MKVNWVLFAILFMGQAMAAEGEICVGQVAVNPFVRLATPLHTLISKKVDQKSIVDKLNGEKYLCPTAGLLTIGELYHKGWHVVTMQSDATDLATQLFTTIIVEKKIDAK